VGSLIGQLAVILVLVLLGLVFGKATERRHLRDLDRRESGLSHVLLTDIRSFPGGADPAMTPTLVIGDAVIATDYVKSILATIRMILGGEVRSFEGLMVRARREAILRMVEQADRIGCNAVCNVRLSTGDIGGATRCRAMVTVAVCASGTAYRTVQDSPDDQAIQ